MCFLVGAILKRPIRRSESYGGQARRKVRQGLRSVWILGRDRVGGWDHREGHGWDFGLAWFGGDLLIAMPKVSVELDHGVVEIEKGFAAQEGGFSRGRERVPFLDRYAVVQVVKEKSLDFGF